MKGSNKLQLISFIIASVIVLILLIIFRDKFYGMLSSISFAAAEKFANWYSAMLENYGEKIANWIMFGIFFILCTLWGFAEYVEKALDAYKPPLEKTTPEEK